MFACCPIMILSKVTIIEVPFLGIMLLIFASKICGTNPIQEQIALLCVTISDHLCLFTSFFRLLSRLVLKMTWMRLIHNQLLLGSSSCLHRHIACRLDMLLILVSMFLDRWSVGLISYRATKLVLVGLFLLIVVFFSILLLVSITLNFFAPFSVLWSRRRECSILRGMMRHRSASSNDEDLLFLLLFVIQFSCLLSRALDICFSSARNGHSSVRGVARLTPSLFGALSFLAPCRLLPIIVWHIC